MIVVILIAAWAFAFPPLLTLAGRLVLHLPVRSPRFFPHWAQAAAGGLAFSLIGCLASGETWTYPASSGASGLLALILWWLSRRKRKRSLKALGHKARARLAAMLRSMPKPGPVLRPVPQGARA